MMKKQTSPCEGCTRVQDPGKCENKTCKIWRAWFLHRWAEIYRYGQRYGHNGKG